jgi:hypothetical protein
MGGFECGIEIALSDVGRIAGMLKMPAVVLFERLGELVENHYGLV